MFYSTKLISGAIDRFRDLAKRLRAHVRAREIWLTALAAVAGAMAGAFVAGMSSFAQTMHERAFEIPVGTRLSGMASLDPYPTVLVPAIGGLLLGFLTLLVSRWRPGPNIDPIEANALNGGRMSLTDSVIVTIQTLISNGFGASVGLEAGYTQIGSGAASRLGAAFRLRRNDMRLLVGCGSAGAIAAAFNAPLTGAFYGFEIIIGIYSVASVAPVAAAALAGTVVARALGMTTYVIDVPNHYSVKPFEYGFAIFIGFLCAGLGILVMRSVAVSERLFKESRLPAYLRPGLGGLAVGGLAILTPQVLASGHGALHIDIGQNMPALILIEIILLKILASTISLGSGFRGGLFFASLLLGALTGKLLASLMAMSGIPFSIDPVVLAVTTMGALAVAIIGGPLTMAFLALETTHDFAITGMVITASIIAGLTVRETFGYSFSTWRFHLRGQAIRSAHDVGLIRSLTVGRLMRPDVRTIPVHMPLSEFREQFPLGSTQRVVLVDNQDRYAGMVLVPEVYMKNKDNGQETSSLASIMRHRDDVLLPSQNVKEAMAAFDRSESEALAIIDDPKSRKVVGLLTEAHAIRRYAEELDKMRRGLAGEN